MRRLAVGAAASALAALLIPAAVPTAEPARTAPATAKLIDCACYDLVRVRTDGTHRVVLSRGGSRALEDVSRDATKILFQQYGGLLEISTLTGLGRQRVAGAPGLPVGAARFSPDGTRVAYALGTPSCEGRSSIHVVAVDGTDDRALPRSCFVQSAPAWSPEGREIAYARAAGTTSGGGSELVAENVETGVERVVASRSGLVVEIAWSPTGDRMAYVEFGRGGSTLHVVRADGSADLVLAQGDNPSWSPDARRLAYLRSRPRGIAVIARDGTHNHVVDPRAIDPYGQGIAWAPDGRRLAYRVRVGLAHGETMALWTARADGGHRRRVVTGVRDEEIGPLRWPSRTTIVYGRLVQSGE